MTEGVDEHAADKQAADEPIAPGPAIPPSRERLYHRQMGILMALFLVLLTVTGIVLNHALELDLDRSYIPESLAAVIYSAEESEVIVFAATSDDGAATDDDYVIWTNGRVYWHRTLVGSLDGALIGSVRLNGELVIASASEIVLITPDGQVAERIGASFLPGELSGLGMSSEGRLVLSSNASAFEASAGLTIFSEFEGEMAHSQPLEDTPSSLADFLTEIDQTRAVSWQRFLSDLHTGRIFGSLGPFFFDLIALLLLSLSTTGIVLWLRVRRRQR